VTDTRAARGQSTESHSQKRVGACLPACGPFRSGSAQCCGRSRCGWLALPVQDGNDQSHTCSRGLNTGVSNHGAVHITLLWAAGWGKSVTNESCVASLGKERVQSCVLGLRRPSCNDGRSNRQLLRCKTKPHGLTVVWPVLAWSGLAWCARYWITGSRLWYPSSS
jgi:hypothetical protein